ncbi:hypothetical protein TNCV_2212431 [Trichonephila clavipes]|nr:hypothetical protein TNCV_2212431 [Trichonephila clavipes]
MSDLKKVPPAKMRKELNLNTAVDYVCNSNFNGSVLQLEKCVKDIGGKNSAIKYECVGQDKKRVDARLRN